MASISSLPPTISTLVQAATAQINGSFGKTESEKVEVQEWFGKVSRVAEGLSRSDDLKELDVTLTSKTYLVGNTPTGADIALYATLHPVVSKFNPQTYYSYPSITRFFDHIQHLSSIRDLSTIPPPALVTFDLENAPRLERQSEAPKKKSKKEAEGAATATAPTPPPNSEPTSKTKKEDKKEKASKKESTTTPTTGKPSTKNAQAPAVSAPPSDDSLDPAPSMIDLRVGHIVEIQKHPDADGLYVEKIDLGEETGPRTVVSGLVHYIPIEQMRDRDVVVVCNLKPANMRGVKSYGMLLCATSKDGKDAGIETINPPKGSKPGERIYFEGDKYQNAIPVSQLNPKKKIFETIQPGFTTLETREAAWIDPTTKSVHRIVTKDGPCSSATLIGASLS